MVSGRRTRTGRPAARRGRRKPSCAPPRSPRPLRRRRRGRVLRVPRRQVPRACPARCRVGTGTRRLRGREGDARGAAGARGRAHGAHGGHWSASRRRGRRERLRRRGGQPRGPRVRRRLEAVGAAAARVRAQPRVVAGPSALVPARCCARRAAGRLLGSPAGSVSMSLPPEKASELKQLIHQQLSKVRAERLGGREVGKAPGLKPERRGGSEAAGTGRL